jgi:23S rRNA (cytosine1962-C5)-methyltransferase
MSDNKFEMFANRLEKVYRHIGKWARKQDVTCFRVYDDDISEFPLAIDIYDQILHVSEYARPHELSPDEHVAWLDGCMEVMSTVLKVEKSDIYLKFRQRQQGLQQYERYDRAGVEKVVTENGLQFIINPSDYLDTGLFLDHRNTRKMVRDLSAGKSVLNLFAYTGAFSVYAAAGGATSTDTVDLSNTYLQWAKKNMELNGYTGKNHRFVQIDVLDWLHEEPEKIWDLIVLDPPTFSNSKRMRGTLDIQRDHAWLLQRVLERLAPGGKLFFSTNFRKFKMDPEASAGAAMTNITGKTIPEDFRDKRIHHCFLLQK